MSRRDAFDSGHGKPDHSLEGIMSQREWNEIAGQALGEHMWNTMEEMMGGPGSYRASVNLAATEHAHKHFPAGKIEFDEEDSPVFRHQVTPDIHVEYGIPHESAEGADKNEYFYADMYKTKGGKKAPLDVLYIPGPARHNPEYIAQSAKEWVDETYTPNKEDYDRGARYE